jgi:pyrroline-5-carboxylate reductase
MRELRDGYGIKATTDNHGPAKAQIVVLSVKPQILSRVLDEVAKSISADALVISIAAGVPVAAIQERLARGARVVRAMPNTPALVDAGATAIARGEHARDSDLDDAKRIFDAVGLTVTLEESQLDAVTGLSGSGPAYVFLILEALSDAGVKVGLSRRTAQLLAAQTVLGSAKLLLETNEHPGRLKDMVTSPGGTAITGLHTLEEGGIRTTLMNAVEAATRRSKELGEALLKRGE